MSWDTGFPCIKIFILVHPKTCNLGKFAGSGGIMHDETSMVKSGIHPEPAPAKRIWNL
jgi:hypothetical protein